MIGCPFILQWGKFVELDRWLGFSKYVNVHVTYEVHPTHPASYPHIMS